MQNGILSAGWMIGPSGGTPALEIKARLARLGLSPVGTYGANFAVILRKQYNEFGRIIREANIEAVTVWRRL
jgi:hypothetical protein